MTFQVGGSVSGRVQSGGVSPRMISIRGRDPRWKDTFAIDDKGGDIYQMQSTKAWFQGERWSQEEHE
jgi:hypothetical protein